MGSKRHKKYTLKLQGTNFVPTDPEALIVDCILTGYKMSSNWDKILTQHMLSCFQ